MLIYKCDLCGKTCEEWDIQKCFSLTYDAGYGSKYDGEHISIDMCCDCFDKLMTEYIEPKRKHISTLKGGEI